MILSASSGGIFTVLPFWATVTETPWEKASCTARIPALAATLRNSNVPAECSDSAEKITGIASPLLREDYKGVRFTPRPTEASRYQAPFRPIVASRYPALGYWSGGSHVPEEESYYDYLVKPLLISDF